MVEEIKRWLKGLNLSNDRSKTRNHSHEHNFAIKSAIEEWKKRNDATKIKVAHSVLSDARSKNSMLESMGELKLMYKHRQNGRVQMHSLGFIPLLAMFVEHDDIQPCEPYIDRYDSLVASPVYDGVPTDWGGVYAEYLWAVEHLLDTSSPIMAVCTGGGGRLTNLEYGIGRTGINEALTRLYPAIEMATSS